MQGFTTLLELRKHFEHAGKTTGKESVGDLAEGTRAERFSRRARGALAPPAWSAEGIVKTHN